MFGGKLLLFVDNLDKSISADPGLQRLKTIPGAIVLTSRQTSFGDEFDSYPIGFLEMEQCKDIYEKIRFSGGGGKVKLEEIEEHPDIVILYNNLTGVYIKQEEYKKAEELYEKSLQINKRVFGEEHFHTIASYNNLAGMYEEQREYDKARELYEKNLPICKRVLGDGHHLTASIYYNLGALYARQGEYQNALVYCIKAYKIMIFKLGEDHPDTKITYKNMEMIYEKYNPKGNFNQWLEEKMKE